MWNMIKGSCLCKAIQFEILGEAKQINLCHCKMCQKFSGSAFGSFTRIDSSDFKIVKGVSEEKVYDSSDFAARAFCNKCGSSFKYINKDKPEYVFVATGTLDDDPIIRPKQHIFLKDKACWFDIGDKDIPQFQDWKSSLK